jgi:hypothetical protein
MNLTFYHIPLTIPTAIFIAKSVLYLHFLKVTQTSLVPWSRLFLEKVTVTQVIKKFLIFYTF